MAVVVSRSIRIRLGLWHMLLVCLRKQGTKFMCMPVFSAGVFMSDIKVTDFVFDSTGTGIIELDSPRLITDDKIAMLTMPPTQCPECLMILQVMMTEDRLRMKFSHFRNTCSRSNTEFFRPVAQFVEFI